MSADRVLVAISLCLALVAAVLTLGPLSAGRDPASFPYVFTPAVATLLPLASDRLAALILAAALMLLFVALEVLTIGVYFLPAAGAMSAAALSRSSTPL
ncbi:MAG: hypothetical protein QOG34_1538 [Frankiaceae bacterium]|nr:hypothetical protein [Frankiaceae bacterium]